MKRLLVGCEYSGRVREAFRNRGWDAWSVDLILSEDNSPYHIQGDVEEIARHGWDAMIAHPPCTFTCSSSMRWIYEQPGRMEKANDAIRFFRRLMELPIREICLENPIGLISSRYRKPDQIIHPWQFGHGEKKRTGLWLKNLPILVATNIVEGREPRIHHMPPGPDRWKERSRTYQGWADAMAEQWGNM